MGYNFVKGLLVVLSFLLFSYGEGWALPSIQSDVELDSATGMGKIRLQTNRPSECGFAVPLDSTSQQISTKKVISTRTLTEADLPEQDPSADYPLGLVEFSLFCPGIVNPESVGTSAVDGPLTVDVYITFEGVSSIEGRMFRKYGPTPDNKDWHWYDFSWDGQTGVVSVDGNRVTLRYVDALRGDDNVFSADNAIFDQIGPTNGSQAVPSMTRWGIIIFMVLAGLGSLWFLITRRPTGN